MSELGAQASPYLDFFEEGPARAPLRRRLGRAARALGRLVAVAAIGMAGDAWCGWRSRRAADPHAESLACLQRISQLLIEWIGVEVAIDGEPPQGAALVVANHRSYVDIPLVQAQLRGVFLSKVEIGGWPVFGRLARRARTVFVRREDRESRRRALRALAEHLDAERTIAVFPEGSTTRGPGVGALRWGSFRLAAARGVPVVPVAISYADRRDAWVDDDDFVSHFLSRFAEERMRVTVSFGPPLRGDDGVELARRAQAWIAERLRALDRTMLGAEPSAQP